jgi:hypothetical protein
MGRYRDMGSFNGDMVNYTPGSSTSFSVNSMRRAFNDSTSINRFTDGAIATAGAFLVSELEKRDPIVRVPLTSFTYARDIPIKTGVGLKHPIACVWLRFDSVWIPCEHNVQYVGDAVGTCRAVVDDAQCKVDDAFVDIVSDRLSSAVALQQ